MSTLEWRGQLLAGPLDGSSHPAIGGPWAHHGLRLVVATDRKQ
jgi:hypothetical protein